MTYDEFKEKLLGEIGERLGKPAVKIIAVTKNNNVQKDAVTLSDCEAALNPVVYLDDLYKECMTGKRISECVDQIVELFHGTPEFDSRQLFDSWEEAKDRIELDLANTKWNEGLFTDTPHKEFLDLTVYCRLVFAKDETGIASTVVKDSMLVRWGISEQEMWEAASSNLKKEAYQFMNLQSLIEKSAEAADIKERRNADMCILTNPVMYYGAAGILRTDLLEKFAQLKETDLYVLPSSVHEVILLPALDCWDVDELRQMVKSVNAGSVDKMDWLSDEVYYYRRESGEVVIAE